MLVVCGDDVIIFSDKLCEFKNSGDLKTDWSRWYHKAIRKSAEQLFGAKRWIRDFPTRLYLDRECNKPFPLDLSQISRARYHFVVVAGGAKERCQSELGGSGSLILCPGIVGQAHTGADCKPFYVGEIDPKNAFLHVFDEVTLDVILRELDTISDFIRYLRRKEIFIRSGKLAVAAGEENLLSFYVSNMGEGGHDILLPSGYDQLVVEDGHWQRHISSTEFLRKKCADEISYVWDSLIEDFSQHAVNGTALATNAKSLADYELALRIMAKESRLDRRMLSKSFIDTLEKSTDKWGFSRTNLSVDSPGTAYVFFAAPDESETDNDYRERRRWFLEQYCFVLAWKRNLRRVVGIATERGIHNAGGRSHDLLVYQPSEWTEEMKLEAQNIQKQLNILYDHKLKFTPYHDDEYPAAPQVKTSPSANTFKLKPHFLETHRVGRNEPCPCGSGLKFKKCCLHRRA